MLRVARFSIIGETILQNTGAIQKEMSIGVYVAALCSDPTLNAYRSSYQAHKLACVSFQEATAPSHPRHHRTVPIII